MPFPCLIPRGSSDRSFNSIALTKGRVFYCPHCQKRLAVVARTISWAESSWFDGLCNKEITVLDGRYYCDHCETDISDTIIHPANWQIS
jgi:hypothetical protein